MMSDDELQSVDDWRFDNRIATRSDAVRRLVQIALRFDRQFQAIYEETGMLSDLVPRVLDKLKKGGPRPEPGQLFNADISKALIIGFASLSIGQNRLVSLLSGVLQETAALKDEEATADAIRRAEETAAQYYASIEETLKPLFPSSEDLE